MEEESGYAASSLAVHHAQWTPEVVCASGHCNLRENFESLERCQCTGRKTVTENET